MLESLFASKNKKLVNGWVKEHKKIVEFAHKIIESYEKGDLKATKKALKSLNDIAIMHLMTEDLEFYRLLKDEKRADEESQKLINNFTTSFKDTKATLRDFLLTYTNENATLDAKFFQTFKTIVAVLGERIAFEEEKVYKKLASK